MMLWEPLAALSLSIFITLGVFLAIYSCCYWSVKCGFHLADIFREVINKDDA